MKKYKTNSEIFTKENEISFYLLGSFITDGNIYIDKNNNHRISIASIDLKWIETIRSLISPEAKIRKNSGCYEFRFRDLIIRDWLISYGCTPQKSKNLELKKPIPPDYIFDFLRGVIDGDGCICSSFYTKNLKSGKKTYPRFDLYITSGSEVFAKQLQLLIKPFCEVQVAKKHKKEITMSNGKIIKPTIIWSVQSGTLAIKKLLADIYYLHNKINLTRKQKIVDDYCR